MTARLRLFCLPNAGGGGTGFLAWRKALLPDIEVVPVWLPGRDTRANEPPIRDCPQLIASLLPELVAQSGSPYALFGHSMGALIAYELACAMRDAGQPAPHQLIVSGYRAPHLPRRYPSLTSNEAILDFMAALGGIPDELLRSHVVRDYMLVMMRADLELIENYELAVRQPLSCPIVAMTGESDPICPPSDLEAWRQYTTGRFVVHTFAGGHFYLSKHVGTFLPALRACLAE